MFQKPTKDDVHSKKSNGTCPFGMIFCTKKKLVSAVSDSATGGNFNPRGSAARRTPIGALGIRELAMGPDQFFHQLQRAKALESCCMV